MPNHVQNVLLATGPKVVERMQKYWVKLPDPDKPGTGYGPVFDFNQLIPMPEVASQVQDSSHAPPIITLMAGGSGMMQAWEDLRGWDRNAILGPWIGIAFENIETKLEKVERAFPGSVANARLMARCIGETGFKSWYEWSIHHWGTKWNAYDCVMKTIIRGEEKSVELRYETAWSVPLPVLEKLAEVEPSLSFEYYAFDEGWNFMATGHGERGKFKLDKTKPVKRDKRTEQIYEVCYGQLPEYDEE